MNHGLLWECELCCTERPGKLEYVKRRCVVVKTSASGTQTAIGREGSLGEVVGSTYV